MKILLFFMIAIESLLAGRSLEAQKAIGILAQKELERRQKENPLKYYVPNGAIESLINEIGKENGKWIYVLPAANSVGKSAAAINILGNIIWGSQSKWFNGERFSNWKYPKKFWYISENSTLKDFVCGISPNSPSEIRKWFPSKRYEFAKAGLDFFSRLTTDNGWEGTFKTYDMDASKFESDKIGVAIFDEPPPEVIFNAVLSRLLLGGIVIMPMTPLFHSAWVKDRLVDKAGEEGNPTFVLYADIESNCKQHGIRGRLDHSQIEKIVSQYDPDEREAREKGRFMHLAGLVFKNIHPAHHRHNTPPSNFKHDNYRIFNVVDPHDSRPPFVAWFAVDRFGSVFCIDEYPKEPFHLIKRFNGTTADVVKAIKEIEFGNGWDRTKIIRVMDPNFGRKQIQAVGKTVCEHFSSVSSDLGYATHYTTDVMDNLESGHRLIRDALNVDNFGDVKFKIGENCPNVWHQLTHYAIKEHSPKRLETDGMSEIIQQRYKDGVDVCRYMFAYLMKPNIPKEEKVYKTMDEYMQEEVFSKFEKRKPRRSGLMYI